MVSRTNASHPFLPPPTGSIPTETALHQARSLQLRARVTSVLRQLAQELGPLTPVSPECFLSYSWGDPLNEARVHQLADDLGLAGVRVKLDIRHNLAGTQIEAFTKYIETVQKVVFLATPLFKEKWIHFRGVLGQREIPKLIARYQKGAGNALENGVIPAILEGDPDKSIPDPFQKDPSVYVDFRPPQSYHTKLIQLIRSLYDTHRHPDRSRVCEKAEKELMERASQDEERLELGSDLKKLEVLTNLIKTHLADLNPLSIPQWTPPLPSPPTGYFSPVEVALQQQQFQNALHNLFLNLAVPRTIPFTDLPHAYRHLFALWSHLTRDAYGVLTDHLPEFLHVTSHLHSEQHDLLTRLTTWCCTNKLYRDGMIYGVVALEMAQDLRQDLQLHHCHLTNILYASSRDYFVTRERTLQDHLGKAFREGEDKKIEALLTPLSNLLLQDQKKNFFQAASNHYNELNPTAKKKLKKWPPFISQNLQPAPSPRPLTENYRRLLATFRDNYSDPSTRTQNFYAIVNSCLKDAFNLLGPPPCGYNILDLGPAGRDLVKPHTHFRPLIILERKDSDSKNYFENFLDLLDLQLRSLGETPLHTPQPNATLASSSQQALYERARAYLAARGFDLKEDIPADGNCFFHAYLKSLDTFPRPQIPLDRAPDKVQFLREEIAQLLTDPARADTVRQDKAWIAADGEGDLLAHLHSRPIRLLTVTEHGESDTLTPSDRTLPKQEWDTLPDGEKPTQYIFIVDVGHHFLYATPQKELDPQEGVYPDNVGLYLAIPSHRPETLVTLEEIPLTQQSLPVFQAPSLRSDTSDRRQELKARALIPDKTGYRLDSTLREEALLRQLDRITTETPGDVKVILSTDSPCRYLTRYLTREAAQALIDPSGRIKREKKGCAHPVATYQNLYFKEKPTHPLMEYAIHNLFYRIAGPLTPTTRLVRFETPLKAYPVLVSEAFDGKTLKETTPFEGHEPTDAAWREWSWLLLCSLLTRPGDGLPSNYLTTPTTITCIDNDISFVDPPAEGNTARFCSILFCYFKDKPLHRDVLIQFCLLNSQQILHAWVEDVLKQEKAYATLFTDDEQKQLYNEDPTNRFKLIAAFRSGTLATLNIQFVQLQSYLKTSNKENVTALQLLEQLISFRLKGRRSALDIKAYHKTGGEEVAALYRKTRPEELRKIIRRDQTLTSLKSDEYTLGQPSPPWERYKKGFFSIENGKNELMETFISQFGSEIQLAGIKKKDDKGNEIATSAYLECDFKNITLEGEPDLDRQALMLAAITYLNGDGNLKRLVIRNCAALSLQSVIPLLSPTLTHLDLTGSPKLTALAGEGFFYNGPLKLPGLKHLVCTRCPSLKEIRVEAPHLERLEIEDNPVLSKVDLGTGRVLLREIKQEGSPNVQFSLYIFGAAEWKKYFGDVGAEPPLPSNIKQILNGPCPIWRGKKVHETHLLVLVPRTVNGKPLNLEVLGEVVKNPLQGPATNFRWFNLGEYKDPAVTSSHWVLLSRDVIPGSRNKSYDEQQRLVQNYAGYEVPNVLDATVALFMEHVRSGTRLYSDSPWTYTRCQEKYASGWQLVVGGFSAAGLNVDSNPDDCESGGVGVQRKF